MSEKQKTESLPVVTVVIPTHNRLRLLPRAIQSVIKQTYKNIEITVVDDCSNNSVEPLLEDNFTYSIQYIRHERIQGLAASRNTGIRRARGEYIAFLDDDDMWKPEKVEKQMRLAVSLPREYGIVYCGAERRDTKKNSTVINHPKIKGDIRDEITRKGLFSVSSSILIKRKTLEKIGGFDESLKSHVDFDLWMNLAKYGYNATCVEEPLVITFKDSRMRMTGDVSARLKATRQYIEKWDPELVRWFGRKKAKNYCRRFYSKITIRQGVYLLDSGKIGAASRLFGLAVKSAPFRLKNYFIITIALTDYCRRKINGR